MSDFVHICNKCGRVVRQPAWSISWSFACNCGGVLEGKPINMEEEGGKVSDIDYAVMDEIERFLPFLPYLNKFVDKTVKREGGEMTRKEQYAPVVMAQCAICGRRAEPRTPEIEGFVGILGKNICDKCMGLIREYLEGTVSWTVAKPEGKGK